MSTSDDEVRDPHQHCRLREAMLEGRLYWAKNKHIPALDEEITSLQSELAQLREQVESLTRERDDQAAIVARIWKMLGSPTYEELAGRSIYDLIGALQAKVEALEAALRRVQDEANTVCGDWRETASLIDSICIAALTVFLRKRQDGEP